MTRPDPSAPVPAKPARIAIVLAFAAIYCIWGTTFLGIRYAVETLPPFLMGATRFLFAGALLFAWTRLRGVPLPPRALWKPAFVAGFFMMLIAQGSVSWAEQKVPSGLAAVIVATTPIWFLLLDWVAVSRRPPRVVTALGLAVGLCGVVLLIAPWQTGARDIDLLGAVVLVLGSFSWATGSLYTRTAKSPSSHLQATAMQMLAGGTLLLVAGTLVGDWGRLDPGTVSTRSVLALLYLSIVGSLVALTAYTWLLGVVAPSRVSTYAYVNPVVAVLLGTLVAGEALTLRMLLAMALILGAVVVATLAKPRDGTGVIRRIEKE
jgi:drug/metabolite transporter (DMT)-like permease